MLPAKLIRTVVTLSLEKGKYSCKKEDLIFIKNEIDHKIYPALKRLIQIDTDQFDKVINARKNRDNATDIIVKSKYSNIALGELKLAIEIPIEIAKHCIRLAEFAIFIFDNGFQAVRGDSSVAINGAISAVAGSLSIINLNLLSLISDEWTEKTRNEADSLMIARDKLLVEENDRQQKLKDEADRMHKFHLELNEFKSGLQLNDKLTSFQIEELVSKLQNAMWHYRDSIWKRDIPTTPIEIIDPVRLFKRLGYIYEQKDTLGLHDNYGATYEVAGIIDSESKHVSISKNFTPQTINFTIAHELGHAILHPNLVLHRDRPIDGSSTSATIDIKEWQANKFASYFLMPSKLVRKQFKGLFLSTKIGLNTATALALGMRITDLRARCKNVRDLSRIIAGAEQFGTVSFPSIANQFEVSNETMAIRLEELNLISLD
jgi:Zn-dependent peptidase ImmA (M78 family)/formiminotetrahydrofolate cyclodeaminase